MVRLLLIGVVTLIVGGAVVGYTLYKQSQPEGLAVAAGHRPLADYLAKEHLAAVQEGEGGQFDADTVEEFRSVTGVWLGRQMDWSETLLAPDSGVRFIGAREVQVPGPGRSVHVLLATGGGEGGGAWVSVFLQQYRATPELERNVAYRLPSQSLGSGAPPIVVYVPGGQIHYIVTDSAEAMNTVRAALGVPEPTKEY